MLHRGDTAGGSRLNLYADFMSQPSRACVIFSRLHGLPVDVVPTLIHKGATRSAAYLAINPLGKVPCLEDAQAGLRLPESAAIMAYLSYRFPDLVPEHWYPRGDPAARARVDAALHWYQGSIRAGAMRVAWNKVVAALLGQQGDERLAQHGMEVLQAGLAALEGVWLRSGSQRFMTGAQPCAADLLAACELEQLTLLVRRAHGTCLDDILAAYPAVRAWRADVRQACGAHYGQAHAVLAAAAAKGAAAATSKL